MLVSDGERALLGRQASWAPGRYSTIAGFVEPGETIEEAVAREIHEEAGIEIPDEDAERIATVQDAIDYIADKAS